MSPDKPAQELPGAAATGLDLRLVFDFAPAGLAVLRPPDWLVLDHNPSFLRIVGQFLGEARLLGCNLLAVLPEAVRSEVSGLLQRASEEGLVPLWEHELRIEGKAATYWSGSIVRLPGGDLLVIAMDSTQNVRAREEANRLQRQMEALVNAMAEGAVVATADGKITALNPSCLRMMGYSSLTDFLNRVPDLFEAGLLLYPDGGYVPVPESPIGIALRGEVFSGLEYLVRRSDGTYFLAQFSGSPVLDDRGGISLGVITFRDITEVRNREREQADFIHILGHDLKGAISTIGGWADLLRQPAVVNNRQIELVNKGGEAISARVSHVTKMIDQLLQAARLDEGKIEFAMERVDLGALTRQAVDDFRHSSDRHSLALSCPENVPVLGDSSSLLQVLDNLLSNAIRYSDKGEVRVVLETGEREALLSVSDQGIGIPAEKLDRVFDRYFQASSDGTRGGLGLGLYIARCIVHAHGGRIWVVSRGLGQGSTFWVSLPLAQRAG